MTDRIQHIIDDIRKKTSEMHLQLTVEREKSREFQSELIALKEILEASEKREAAAFSTVADLKLELETAKSQVVNHVPSIRKDEDIDELVKEIEYCISQLIK